jgi:hypothetical protein
LLLPSEGQAGTCNPVDRGANSIDRVIWVGNKSSTGKLSRRCPSVYIQTHIFLQSHAFASGQELRKFVNFPQSSRSFPKTS